MADKTTLGIRAGEEITKKFKELATLSNSENNEEFLQRLITSYELEQTKKEVPIVNEAVRATQILFDRMTTILIGLGATIKTEQEEIIKNKDELEEGLKNKINDLSKIISELQENNEVLLKKQEKLLEENKTLNLELEKYKKYNQDLEESKSKYGEINQRLTEESNENRKTIIEQRETIFKAKENTQKEVETIKIEHNKELEKIRFEYSEKISTLTTQLQNFFNFNKFISVTEPETEQKEKTKKQKNKKETIAKEILTEPQITQNEEEKKSTKETFENTAEKETAEKGTAEN